MVDAERGWRRYKTARTERHEVKETSRSRPSRFEPLPVLPSSIEIGYRSSHDLTLSQRVNFRQRHGYLPRVRCACAWALAMKGNDQAFKSSTVNVKRAMRDTIRLSFSSAVDTISISAHSPWTSTVSEIFNLSPHVFPSRHFSRSACCLGIRKSLSTFIKVNPCTKDKVKSKGAGMPSLAISPQGFLRLVSQRNDSTPRWLAYRT